MMESVAKFYFNVSEKDQEKWELLVSDLTAGHIGFRFEEHIEYFGRDAEALLEEILDYWQLFENESVLTEQCKMKGNKVFLQFEGLRSIAGTKDLLRQLLLECGAQELKVDYMDEDIMSGDE